MNCPVLIACISYCNRQTLLIFLYKTLFLSIIHWKVGFIRPLWRKPGVLVEPINFYNSLFDSERDAGQRICCIMEHHVPLWCWTNFIQRKAILCLSAMEQRTWIMYLCLPGNLFLSSARTNGCRQKNIPMQHLARHPSKDSLFRPDVRSGVSETSCVYLVTNMTLTIHQRWRPLSSRQKQTLLECDPFQIL